MNHILYEFRHFVTCTELFMKGPQCGFPLSMCLSVMPLFTFYYTLAPKSIRLFHYCFWILGQALYPLQSFLCTATNDSWPLQGGSVWLFDEYCGE